jgi:hypothetical protein
MTSLNARLREQGLTCRIESRDRLLILTPQADAPPLGPARLDIVRIAQEEGYTHVALELDPDGAALSRD